MKIFISHSSCDGKAVGLLNKALTSFVPEINIFNSSSIVQGAKAGEKIVSRLSEEITSSSFVILLASENYLRSLYCLFEMCIAMNMALEKRVQVIPIFQDDSVVAKFSSMFGSVETFLHINCSRKKEAVTRICEDFLKLLDKQRVVDDCLKSIVRRMVQCFVRTKTIHRAFIGMDGMDYKSRYQFIEDNGIKRISFEPAFSPIEIAQMVECADEVWVVATTGAAIIKSIQKSLERALIRGAQINIVMPNKRSSFCIDVGDIEVEDDFNTEANRIRLDYEFDCVVGNYLNEAIVAAKKKAPKTKGSVDCYCCGTLFRQTIVLTKRNSKHVKGWTTATLPPSRAITRSMSVGFESVLRDDTSVDKWSYADFIYRHCTKLREFAKSRGGHIRIDGSKYSEWGFGLERDSAYVFWKEKEIQARLYMAECRSRFGMSALIEVAAQHPLHKGLPGEEFRRRLDAAIELKNRLVKNGYIVKLYVPGSVHKYNNVIDPVSLSKAGCDYLMAKGVEPDAILGESMNQKYKGSAGVYNTADECYVAASVFKEGKYAELYSVCSPNQIPRKTLYYIAHGVVPLCISVPMDNMFHSMVDELFGGVENVVLRDHDGQDPRSSVYRKSRAERRPTGSLSVEQVVNECLTQTEKDFGMPDFKKADDECSSMTGELFVKALRDRGYVIVKNK